MISNQMRNLTIGLISLLSMGCNFLPDLNAPLEKGELSRIGRGAWEKFKKDQKEKRQKEQDQQRQQQDEQSNTNLVDGIDNNVWQENGGRYNILIYHIIVDGERDYFPKKEAQKIK